MPVKISSALWGIPAIAIVLLWPALLNGYPFLFADTDPYIRQGQQILPAIGALAKGTALPSIDYLQSRSGVFGAYLYGGYRLADFWSIAILQALTIAWLTWTCARTFGVSGRALLVLTVVLALTTAPFEAVFMMPDAWTGMGVLAGLLLVLAPDKLGRLQKVCACVGFLFFVTIHQTHLILALLIAGSGIGLLLLAGRTLRNAVQIAVPLLAMAVVGLAVNVTLQGVFGSQLSTAPFLSARMLADGPGRKHLDTACAKDPDAYELCRYRDNALQDTLATLFSTDPRSGAFAIADREGQIRMLEEQSRFVLSSALNDPLGTIGSAFANGFRQLAKFSLWEDFGSPAGWTTQSSPDWGNDRARGQILAARSYEPGMPLALISGVIYVVTLVSLAFVLWRLSRRDIAGIIRERADPDAILAIGFVVALLAIIIVNAFLCGALSGPYERFQTRVIWLLPLAAVILAVRFGASDRAPPRPA